MPLPMCKFQISIDRTFHQCLLLAGSGPKLAGHKCSGGLR